MTSPPIMLVFCGVALLCGVNYAKGLAYAMDNLWRIINETSDLDDLKRECSEALCVASRRLSECSSHVDGAVTMAVNGGYEADADYLRGELSAAMGIIEECSEMVDQLTF